ncbi:hypothetical protein M6B38_149735 [Iris pallida]|uniref:Uncharacterized protein n=1 Tax=Iris pallida TaxID=29817 RepID=A0AAX6ES31_IRIPA|nr:hypothetical protein M6B38_107175 [Iris pallida]KAJ6812387.1 hypothetical protein M6B38_149735 [Iris pallida]
MDTFVSFCSYHHASETKSLLEMLQGVQASMG